MSRPMNIDTAGWGPFDPNSASDAMCDRERVAFTEYTLKRLKKATRNGSDLSAIWVGGIMAIVQMTFAIHQGTPPDEARDGLHQVLDYSWLQCASMVTGKEDLN